MWEAKSQGADLVPLYRSFHPTLVLQLDRWHWASHSCEPWASHDTLRGLQGDKSWKAVSDLESSVLACPEDPGHLSHCSYQTAPWITADHSSSFLSWLLLDWMLPKDTNFMILSTENGWTDGRWRGRRVDGSMAARLISGMMKNRADKWMTGS